MTGPAGQVLGSTQVFGSAPPSRAFTIAVLGDGFLAGEQRALAAAVDDFVATLTTTAPFSSMTASINVHRVDVVSQNSAPKSAHDPSKGYFGSAFHHTIERVLECNQTLALHVAAEQVPTFRLAALVVNTETYGGSGGGVAVYSLDPAAVQIALHESGHTAFGLADEYDTPTPGFPFPCCEPEQPNITLETERSRLKWRHLVAEGTPIPTLTASESTSPVAAAAIGLFEGAYYHHRGIYRPAFDCLMNHLGVPLCAVCSERVKHKLQHLP